jgi:PAS domain S-box-containing protein
MHEAEVHETETWERSRSEEALRESQTAFRELLELVPDAVVVADADHRITDVNTALCKLNGYSREEVIGKTFEDFEPEEAARVAREILPIP